MNGWIIESSMLDRLDKEIIQFNYYKVLKTGRFVDNMLFVERELKKELRKSLSFLYDENEEMQNEEKQNERVQNEKIIRQINYKEKIVDLLFLFWRKNGTWRIEVESIDEDSSKNNSENNNEVKNKNNTGENKTSSVYLKNKIYVNVEKKDIENKTVLRSFWLDDLRYDCRDCERDNEGNNERDCEKDCEKDYEKDNKELRIKLNRRFLEELIESIQFVECYNYWEIVR